MEGVCMNIIVAGGTGFVGRALVDRLIKSGHTPVVLTRKTPETMSDFPAGCLVEQWDARTVGPWAQRLESADAVVNLVGETIAGKRWTDAQKERIRLSRIHATRSLVGGIRSVRKKPAVLVNASGVGYYGHVPDGDVPETHPEGTDFLARTCQEWESEAMRVGDIGVRVVVLRIGVVLGKGGGALQRMVPPFKLFVGGHLGSGKQWFPWIHRDDLLSIVEFAIKHELSGPANAVAPESVTMKSFCRTIGTVLHRPSWAPVPSFALKLLLGEMANMLLTGQKAIPEKLSSAGFAFRFPRLEDALRDVLK